MALDPVILNARTVVEPIKRGRGDERRPSGGQPSFGPPDRAAAPPPRPLSADSKDRAQAAGDREREGRAQPVPFQPKDSPPVPERPNFPGSYLSQAARLSRNDRGPFFAAVGFSVQQLASEEPEAETLGPGQFERGIEAYRKTPRVERAPRIEFIGQEILIGISEPTYPDQVNLST